MLENFGKGLSDLINRLVSGSSVDSKTVEEIISDLRKILLSSDVDMELANRLADNIRNKCLKEKVPAGLTLKEHVLKTIYDELVALLGDKPADASEKKRVMFVGLFGSGKTTSVAKLARYYKKKGKRPALVALDYHRPAAPTQLRQLGDQLKIPVMVSENKDPYECARKGLEEFSKLDVIIFDTAGRNALDGELAEELKRLGEIINPDEVLLAIPADLGKIARKQSEEFNKLVGITGVFITKMDGTAKAGGAIAAASATGAKVKYIGVGEKVEDIELYDPTRFVSRLLGLGDLQTLLEKAKESDLREETVEKIVEGTFTLQDFLEQINAMQSMGPLDKIIGMIPGGGMMKVPKDALAKQEQKMKNYKNIISSMTKAEREDPDIINASRIKRIASGSGVGESEVRDLLAQYRQMKKLMKTLGGQAGVARGSMKNMAKQFGFKL
jgi:signal recognition particle subunit SRP54